MHFSAFCELRPKNILLLEDTPVDQCKCKLHENFRLLLKALCIRYNSSWWLDKLCKSQSLNSSFRLGNCLQCKIKVKKSLKH